MVYVEIDGEIRVVRVRGDREYSYMGVKDYDEDEKDIEEETKYTEEEQELLDLDYGTGFTAKFVNH